MAVVPAAKKNCLITIQKRVDGAYPGGQSLEEWQTYIQLWAWSKTMSGVAGVRGNVMVSINAETWRIDYRDDICVGMRVAYLGEIFDITRVVKDRAGRTYVDLICETGGSDG